MKRTRTLILAVAVGACLAAGQSDDKLSAPAQAAADARAERIKAELAQLKGHEWAGEYYWGDGLGVNVSLLLAPKAGFVIWWRGCLGLYDVNYGGVEATGGRLKLQFELPNGGGNSAGFDPELAPVLWGDRRYLIASDKMLKFVNYVNAGFEPRHEVFGEFFLIKGDERKAARSAPQIPAEYRDLLLRVPIRTRISSVGMSRSGRVGWCASEGRATLVVLDAGNAQGVRSGMEFYVFRPASARYLSVRATKVEAGSSEAEVQQCAEDAPPSPKWKLSARAPGRH
ncbi:MAG: hypothetical protein ACLQGV_12390 [Bryobacteraceae bacterium]